MNGSIIILIIFITSILWWYYGREKIGNPYPNNLMKKYGDTPLFLRLIWGLRLIGIVCATFLFLLILFPKDNTYIPEKKIILVIDISKSMEADDLIPTRLERTKGEIIKFIERSPLPIGIVIFAGKAFTLAPPSGDTPGLIQLISNLSTDTIDQSKNDTSGTNIGDALLVAETLGQNGAGETDIILFTDGRANIGLDPMIVLESLAQNDMSVSTVAIGSESGVILSYRDENGIRTLLRDASGAIQEGNTDRVYLSYLAEKGNGGTYILDDTLILRLTERFSSSYQKKSFDIRGELTPLAWKRAFIFLIVLYALLFIIFIRSKKRR